MLLNGCAFIALLYFSLCIHWPRRRDNCKQTEVCGGGTKDQSRDNSRKTSTQRFHVVLWIFKQGLDTEHTRHRCSASSSDMQHIYIFTLHFVGEEAVVHSCSRITLVERWVILVYETAWNEWEDINISSGCSLWSSFAKQGHAVAPICFWCLFLNGKSIRTALIQQIQLSKLKNFHIHRDNGLNLHRLLSLCDTLIIWCVTCKTET